MTVNHCANLFVARSSAKRSYGKEIPNPSNSVRSSSLFFVFVKKQKREELLTELARHYVSFPTPALRLGVGYKESLRMIRYFSDISGKTLGRYKEINTMIYYKLVSLMRMPAYPVIFYLIRLLQLLLDVVMVIFSVFSVGSVVVYLLVARKKPYSHNPFFNVTY